jgi:integrase
MFSLAFAENTMPSLWKRPTSPYWFCCYTTADGARLKKTTKQTDRTKAWEVCLSIERAERLAKTGNLTEQAAKKIIGEILERTTGEVLHSYVAEEWLDEWLAGKVQTKAAKTADRYRQVIRDFKASLGHRAKLPLHSITPKDIHTYRDEQLAEGKSPKTGNNAVKIVSTAFNAALRQAYITTNPCTALESLPAATAERETFTPEQVASLIEAAEGDWKRAILLGFFSGARLGDVANMRWDSVDLTRKLVTFTPGKTKRTRKSVIIPLHVEMERELLKAPGIGKAALFPTLAGITTGGKYGLSSQFAQIMEKAGIAGTITRHTERGRANRSLSFHSLRHSFNSAMANAGVAQEVRMKLTGQRTADINTVYTHIELEPLRAAIATLPSIPARTKRK